MKTYEKYISSEVVEILKLINKNLNWEDVEDLKNILIINTECGDSINDFIKEKSYTISE